MRVRALVAAVLASSGLLAANDCWAQEPPTSLEALDVAVEEVLDAARIPGAALIVIEDQRIVLSRNYGVADLSTRAPVVNETVFRAGSISKSFTAIGAMMLVEEGRLSLDAEVARCCPTSQFTTTGGQVIPCGSSICWSTQRASTTLRFVTT